jgi:hypothetical protein
MADLPPDVAPGTIKPGGEFNRVAVIASVLLSLFINGVCPYLLYRYLAPHYPDESLTPLVYASAFPIFGLILGYVRTRAIDFIALIALFEITFNVSAALLLPSIRYALIARALQGLLTASIFLISVAIGRPIIFFIARQFATGGDPVRVERFNHVNMLDEGWTFRIATLAWGFGLIAIAVVNTGLALTLSAADYLLFSQFTGIAGNVALVIWSVRYTRHRLERFIPAGAA